MGTDFTKETIVATVKYKDGSIKVSIITPSNVTELNGANQGSHLLKWSDSWGDYCAEIIIE